MDSYNNQLCINTSRNCKYINCTVKRPNFNYPNMLTPIYCKKHLLDGMVDIRSNLCNIVDCKKRATFGYESDHIKVVCSIHKELNMIDLNNKHKSRCLYDKCNMIAKYNYEQYDKGIFCEIHKKDTMINVVKLMCANDDCNLKPYYNYEGHHNGLFCIKHKKLYMIDISSRNNKTKNKTFIYKVERIRIIFDINGLISIVSSKVILNKYEQKMPDFLFDCKTHYLMVELDIYQIMGTNYDNDVEIIRMKYISECTNGRPIWFIRYNTDNYRKATGRKRVPGESQNKRHIKLLEWVKYCHKKSPITYGDYIRAVFLYYDGWDGQGISIQIDPI